MRSASSSSSLSLLGMIPSASIGLRTQTSFILLIKIMVLGRAWSSRKALSMPIAYPGCSEVVMCDTSVQHLDHRYLGRGLNTMVRLACPEIRLESKFTFYIALNNVQYRPDSRLGQSHFSPLLGTGGGDPLCVLASWKWGPTYVYSLLYTHNGLLGRLPLKFYSR
jgi:hypothetical protein